MRFAPCDLACASPRPALGVAFLSIVALIAVMAPVAASAQSSAPRAVARVTRAGALVTPGAALAHALKGVGGGAPSHALVAIGAGGRVPVTVRLGAGERAADLGMLEVAPGVAARWVLPGELDGFFEQFSSRRPSLSPPLRPVLDRSGALWTRAFEAHAAGKTGKGAVVGVIDTGVDVAHPDLRRPDGKTRVAWMLDLASSPRGVHLELEERFGCLGADAPPCAVFSAAEIDELIAGAGKTPTDRVGHGTHVASIAAGNGGGEGRYVGVAPEATIVAVRVTRQAAGESITDVDVLNAVRFVFDRAESMKMPAAVNVSLGGDYGPHDGSSAIEQGLAAFVGPSRPGRAVVAAAGNSAGIVRTKGGEEFGSHTEVRVLPRSTTRVTLASPAASAVKLAGAAYVWVTFQRGDEVRVGLERNGEEVIPPLEPGEQGAIAAEAGEAPYMAILNGVTGEGSPISAATTGAVVVFSGDYLASDRFAITLEGSGTAQLWVQGTGDAAYGSTSGGALFLRPIKQGTINVPATHPDLIAVGCTVNRTDWRDVKGDAIAVKSLGALADPPGDSACYFSGAGPSAVGVGKPEISAPGAFVAAAMSSAASPSASPQSMFEAPASVCASPEACYVVDERHAIASGTSMSAPQVTGAVAVLLAARPTLTQGDLVALLQAGARPFAGVVPLEFQVGPGSLDLRGSLQALDEVASPRGLAPDPARSWIHASAGFVRPDGATPLVVTLLLRATDGGPATGADVRKVSVVVVNGTVTRPAAPLPGLGAAGVMRLEVVAPPGVGGQVLELSVAYDGVEVGRRSLPIGPDVWAARGAPVPKGGCGAGAPDGLAGGAAAACAAAVAAVVRWGRRRSSHRRA